MIEGVGVCRVFTRGCNVVALRGSIMGAVLAFNRRKLDLQKLHRDIDRLTTLTNALYSEGWQREMKTRAVINARAIYENLQERCGTALLSPEEESVIDLKMTRVRSRLRFLGEKFWVTNIVDALKSAALNHAVARSRSTICHSPSRFSVE